MRDEGINGLIGRERELETVGRFLDAVASGAPTLLIDGDAGIGKTSLWLNAITLAEEHGIHVLESRPSERETSLSYAVLADLVGEPFERLRERLPLPQQQVLARSVLRNAAGAAADPRTTSTAFRSLLALVAQDGPALVAVDDIQWADGASQRALAFVARRLPPRVGLLLTRRGTSRDLPLGLATDGVERVTLGPLSLAALHHLLTGRLGWSPSRPVLVALESASKGNPLLALELARSCGSGWRPTLAEALPAAADTTALFAERLARLPTATRTALLAAASLSRPTLELVSEDALEPAEEAELVGVEEGRISFAHPLLGAAVYASATATARRRMHDSLARLVDDPEERARHLSLAASGADAAVSARIEAGAEAAFARGAPEAAGALYEQAARLAVSPTEVERLTIHAAAQLFHAGETHRARTLLERVLEHPLPDPLRAEALRLLGELHSTVDSYPEAIRCFDEALGYASAEGSIAIHLDLTMACMGAAEGARAAHHASEAVSAAAAHGDDGLVAEALAADAMVRFLAADPAPAEQLRHAVALEDESKPARLMMRPKAIAAMIAISSGDLSAGIPALDRVCAWAIERGEESEVPFLLGYRAWGAWWSGDYRGAIATAEEMRRIAEQAGSTALRGLAALHRGVARCYLGDLDGSDADLADSAELMERSGWRFGSTWVATGRCFSALSRGDAAAAAAVVRPISSALSSAGIEEPSFWIFAADEIEALVALGELERAETLAVAFTANARRLGRDWAIATGGRCVAIVEAGRGSTEAAVASVADAVCLQEQVGMPFELARTLLVQGRIERRARRKRASGVAFERALAIFDRLGTPLWAEHARRELARAPQRPAQGGLTESELRVARLAASGRTNREVAQLLFVSPKTVEASLARIYRKLAIRSRAELGARMEAARGLDD